MNKPTHQPNPFHEKWKRAGAEAQRTVGGSPTRIAGKPIARVLWEKAVRKDDAFQSDSRQFNSQVAFSAWLQGWMDAEMQGSCRVKDAPPGSHFGRKKGLRTPEEIADLRKTISSLIEFSPTAEDIQRYNQVHDDPRLLYAAHVGDVLDWVLGIISTEAFTSEDHLDVDGLRKILKR